MTGFINAKEVQDQFLRLTTAIGQAKNQAAGSPWHPDSGSTLAHKLEK